MIAPPASLLVRLVDFLVRRRLPILIVSALVTVAAVYPASQLTFNQSLESLYADDDPHLMDYLASRRWFGGDELVGVVYRDPHLFDSEGLDRVTKLSRKLSTISGVKAESTQDLAANLTAIEKPIFKALFRKQLD